MLGDSHHSVDLYWLPLGAGGRSVRLNGRVFEAIMSRLEHRAASDLYHSALVVRVPEGEFVIEMAPAWDRYGARRGVVAEGPVGSRWARSLRVFRYENRCWRGGVIPDVDDAVESPRRLTDDPVLARRFLELVPAAPTPVWGRDELGTGEMWNSNSLISWLIARSSLGIEAVQPPLGGRAPGWQAGLVVARRQATPTGEALALPSLVVRRRLPAPPALPGADVVDKGLSDLAQGAETVESLLVSIGAPRLRSLGYDVRSPFDDAEQRLFLMLARDDSNGAHSRYNALVRRLVSFERAAESAR